jgi:hypothetical protein
MPKGAVRHGQDRDAQGHDLGVHRLRADLYQRWRCSGRSGREFKCPNSDPMAKCMVIQLPGEIPRCCVAVALLPMQWRTAWTILPGRFKIR